MTQQDIINELNRIIIGYNINWDTIKVDADRAIMKINSHLGAKYPPLSEIMLSPNHRYTLRLNGVDVPIFPEKYLLTVVIPFIATEVLARDEEFTTIYNKFVMDYENGLFDMFQSEFNKVPLTFRQDKDVGVFFSTETAQHKIHDTVDANLPVFKFRVYYHFNHDFDIDSSYTADYTLYNYGAEAEVLDTTIDSFVEDIYAYTFSGWKRNITGDTITYHAGDTVHITGDIHMYAQWSRKCILKNTNGVVSIPDKSIPITSIVIPPYIEGKLVTGIDTNFDMGTNLVSVTLPKTNLTIYSGAVFNTHLRTLNFPEYDYLRDKPNITLQDEAIMGTSIEVLYLPYSVRNIEADAIKGVPLIQCEVNEQPYGWEDGWYEGIDTEVKWGVVNG